MIIFLRGLYGGCTNVSWLCYILLKNLGNERNERSRKKSGKIMGSINKIRLKYLFAVMLPVFCGLLTFGAFYHGGRKQTTIVLVRILF